MSANGTTLRNEILGTVQLRTMLTGMPELRLGLNDKILFESTGRMYWVEKFFVNNQQHKNGLSDNDYFLIINYNNPHIRGMIVAQFPHQ